MMTAGEGRTDCTGVVSGGMGGTRWTGVPAVVAAAKPAALTADSAPVTATTPETPPIVHDPTRRSALSRSLGWYRATSVVPAAATATTVLVVAWLRSRGWARARRGRLGCARGRRTGQARRPRRRRVGHDDRFVHRRRRRGRGIETVGAQRHARQLGRDGVLRRSTECCEWADVARGGDAGDPAGERDCHGGSQQVRASMRAQGGCPPGCERRCGA